MNSGAGTVATGNEVRSGGRALRTIVTAGLVAGALDITYAFIIWGLQGVTPLRIGRSVAAGLVGVDAARAGGVGLGLFGLLLHFTMATIIAAIYYGAARNIRLLVDKAAPCGIVYGLATYGVMNYVVMPLSAIHSSALLAPRPLVGPRLAGVRISRVVSWNGSTSRIVPTVFPGHMIHVSPTPVVIPSTSHPAVAIGVRSPDDGSMRTAPIA